MARSEAALVRTLATVIAMALSVTMLAQGAALPATVKKAFEQAYPGATISATSQARENNQPAFRIDSVDKGRRRAVLYDANGRVIEIAESVQEKELPNVELEIVRRYR